jgi:S1-C subfamily serine protease
LDNNKVITNAHVILDKEDIPTGNYNLCISDTFDLEPKCKTSMKLIKYDKTNDLAILKPVENISFNNPIQFSDKKLNL